MSTEGAVGDWSGTYLALGMAPGFAVAAYAAFSLLMITGRSSAIGSSPLQDRA